MSIPNLAQLGLNCFYLGTYEDVFVIIWGIFLGNCRKRREDAYGILLMLLLRWWIALGGGEGA
jgi:hypothetical protein